MRLVRISKPCAILWLSALWALPWLVGVQTAAADEGQNTEIGQSQFELEARVNELIKQLGSSQYANRQRAKTELKRLRLEAFDALNEAQFNDDIEIALSARYLVRSMQVTWWTDDDPPEVKQLLRQYGSHKEAERRNLMEQLAGLDREMSFRPLCRLVRYEASERLSKKAALLILLQEAPAAEAERREFISDLLARAGKSRRSAAEWLRAYAELLADAPTSHQRWTDLVAGEQLELANSPDETSKELIRDLLKWYADQLAHRSQHEEALAMMRKTIDLLSAKEQELVEAADWFRERESWIMIVELAERYPDTFARNPMLQYRLAFAYRNQQQHAKAEETAQLAMKAVQNEPEHHLEMAANLQHDGLFEWAELEYRHVAEQIDQEPSEAVRAQLYLSELLHELGSDLAAGETLRGLVDSMESKEDILKLVETDLGRELSAIKSRMHFFFAQHHGQLKDFQKQRELLLEGLSSDPHDADVLIAMHRVSESDAEWRDNTLKKIQEAVTYFRGQLQETTERLNSSRSFEEKAMAQFQLALTNNQLAWLISNTQGDFDESLRCSLRSLELQPNRSGFLDTLGRCYYAKGDYANAVKCQSQAVAMEPHSPLIVGQLKLFQEALRQQQASHADGADKGTPLPK